MARYLTDINDADRKWIKEAANELGWKTGDIVSLAVRKLREEKWDGVKQEIARQKLANELAAIMERKQALAARESELQAQLGTV